MLLRHTGQLGRGSSQRQRIIQICALRGYSTLQTRGTRVCLSRDMPRSRLSPPMLRTRVFSRPPRPLPSPTQEPLPAGFPPGPMGDFGLELASDPLRFITTARSRFGGIVRAPLPPLLATAPCLSLDCGDICSAPPALSAKPRDSNPRRPLFQRDTRFVPIQ